MKKSILTAEDFRALAAAYFNKEPVSVSDGICCALPDFLLPKATTNWGTVYDAVIPLLLKHHWRIGKGEYLGGEEPDGTYKGWEPRAWTCLLLAEQMENPYDA